MEILLSGSAAVTDLLKILPAASYTMVSMEEQNKTDNGVRLRLIKGVANRGRLDPLSTENVIKYP